MTLSEGLYHYFGRYVEIPLAALFSDAEPFTVGLVFSAVLVVLVFLLLLLNMLRSHHLLKQSRHYPI